MKNKRFFIRNFEAGNFLETFFVWAVSSILLIRFYLQLTGYPKLGGESLHIAHMLWGGLLMLAAIIILLTFLSRASQHLAAIVGGIGFGTFIDEVGKFVTHDNDYLFQPSVAIMYVIFVLIFISVRLIQKRLDYSSQEYLLNALREMEEVALHDLDEEEQKRALSYLNKTKSENQLTGALKNLLINTELAPPPKPNLLTRIKSYIRQNYKKIVGNSWFTVIVILFFISQLLFKLAYAVILLLFKGIGWDKIGNAAFFEYVVNRFEGLNWLGWAEFGSSLFSAIFVLLGVAVIRKSRIGAYKFFQQSILIYLLVTQIFLFYRKEFGALIGFAANLIIFWTLRILIQREQEMEFEEESEP